LFLAGGLGAGLAAGPFLASLHPGPALLLAVSREDAGQLPAGSSPETRAFRASGQDRQALETQAAAARRTIRLAALPGGLACSLILFLSWQAARRPRRHPDWSIDPRRCVACGRCMAVCPRGES
jgi:hypothetical protein